MKILPTYAVNFNSNKDKNDKHIASNPIKSEYSKFLDMALEYLANLNYANINHKTLINFKDNDIETQNKIKKTQNYKKLLSLIQEHENFLKKTVVFDFGVGFFIENSQHFKQLLDSKVIDYLLNNNNFTDIETNYLLSLLHFDSTENDRKFSDIIEFLNDDKIIQEVQGEGILNLHKFISLIEYNDEIQVKKIKNAIDKGMHPFAINSICKVFNKDSDYNRLLQLLKYGINDGEKLRRIFKRQFTPLEYNHFIEILNKKFDVSSAFNIIYKEKFKNIDKFIDKNDEYDQYHIKNLVNNDYFLMKIKNNPDNTKNFLILRIENNEIKTIEEVKKIADDELITRFKNSDKTYYIKLKKAFLKSIDNTSIAPHADVVEAIDIIHQKDFNIVVHKKASDILNGAFEITEYKTYENDDEKIIQLAKEGKLYAGNLISRISKKNNGSIELNENRQNGDINTKRKYIETYDANGNLEKREYNYLIKNKNNKTLLNNNIVWQKALNNSTVTTVNGEKYKAFFDDTNRTIKIEYRNDTVNFDFMQKFANSNNKNKLPMIWEEFKKYPVNILYLIAKNINIMDIGPDFNSGAINISDNSLILGWHLSSISHEMGHLKDIKDTYYTNQANYSLNKSYINQYLEEWQQVDNKYPLAIKNAIDYFSPYSELITIFSDDLKRTYKEIFAENHMLLSTYSNPFPLAYRAEFLVDNFPKTISLASKMLNE